MCIIAVIVFLHYEYKLILQCCTFSSKKNHDFFIFRALLATTATNSYDYATNTCFFLNNIIYDKLGGNKIITIIITISIHIHNLLLLRSLFRDHCQSLTKTSGFHKMFCDNDKYLNDHYNYVKMNNLIHTCKFNLCHNRFMLDSL